MGDIADLVPAGYGPYALAALLRRLPDDGANPLMYRQVEQLYTLLDRGKPWSAPALEALSARLYPLAAAERRHLLRRLELHPDLVATLRIELEQDAWLRIASKTEALSRPDAGLAAVFVQDLLAVIAGFRKNNARRVLEGMARMAVNEETAAVALGLARIPGLVPDTLPDAAALRRRLFQAVLHGARSVRSAETLPGVLARLDADGQRLLATLLGEVGGGSRPALLEALAALQATTAGLGLPPARQHGLIQTLLESAHTPRDRVHFLGNAARLLSAAGADTPARLGELVDYLLTGRGDTEQQAWLASDLVKAVNRLDDGIGIDKLLDQLTDDPAALAGGDPWLLTLRQAREDWQGLPDPRPLFGASWRTSPARSAAGTTATGARCWRSRTGSQSSCSWSCCRTCPWRRRRCSRGSCSPT